MARGSWGRQNCRQRPLLVKKYCLYKLLSHIRVFIVVKREYLTLKNIKLVLRLLISSYSNHYHLATGLLSRHMLRTRIRNFHTPLNCLVVSRSPHEEQLMVDYQLFLTYQFRNFYHSKYKLFYLKMLDRFFCLPWTKYITVIFVVQVYKNWVWDCS